jgi:predicted TIM-barrel fold metal-dependent hydrolase
MEFLNSVPYWEDKAGIFYNNAARFLKLGE